MSNQTDSIVLTVIDQLNSRPEPFGIRALVEHCRLADKTISKAIARLEQAGRLRVIRGEPGTRHEYKVLDPPTERERMITALRLGQSFYSNAPLDVLFER